MKYGLIGKKLSHSFSVMLHSYFGNSEYELFELDETELDSFFKSRDFKGINVTVPYKERIIPFLDFISDEAKKIGAVNTVINQNGILKGYNTDAFGMKEALSKSEIDLKDRRVLILGSGGTSKTARFVAQSLFASDIKIASRNKRNGFIGYEDIDFENTDVIINTTPCGMYPEMNALPADIKKFKNLKGYFDAVYNPLNTYTAQAAKEIGAKAAGGLYMLCAQGFYSANMFLKNTAKSIDDVYKKILSEKQNLVIIGMPGCGKSVLAGKIAEITGRQLVDTDTLFEQKYGKIDNFIKQNGEGKFRALESAIIEEIKHKNGFVIATGGGTVLSNQNVEGLRLNGKICCLKRDINLLETAGRPLSTDLFALYKERHVLYEKYSDFTVLNSGRIEDTAKEILKEFLK